MLHAATSTATVQHCVACVGLVYRMGYPLHELKGSSIAQAKSLSPTVSLVI